MPEPTPKAPEAPATFLQVRFTAAEKRYIKTFAANQGMTLRQAVLSAFGAWAEKLRARKV